MLQKYESIGRVAKQIIAFVVALSVLCLPISAYGTTVSEKQSQISDAQSDKKNLEKKLDDLEAAKNDLVKSKQNLASYVTQLDADLSTLQVKLTELNQLVDDKREELKNIKAELKNAKQEEAKQYVQMKRRIRFMYEQSEETYYNMIFEADSFSDFINRATYIEQITSYDRQMLEAYEQTLETIEMLQKNLEDEEEVLKAAVGEAKESENQVESLISDKRKQIEEYEADIKDKEQAIKEYEEQIKERDATIRALEKAVAEALAAASVSGNGAIKYSGGKFAWPAPSYTRISSEYGNRVHPTLGVVKFHSGLDMAAPNGSPILAAADGQVIAASYSASMGNYIMINHGDGIFTIYMHASALYVGQGATVKKGQKIAAVGSTGRSTGPHLHFSVRAGGNYVNPWAYLKG